MIATDRTTRPRGFTLIELILVLLLIGALAVFALPAFFDRSQFGEYAYQQDLISALRYSQKLAIASGCEVQATVNAGGYALHYRSGGSDTTCGSGAFTDTVTDPIGGSAYAHGPPAGVTIGSGLTVSFDALGRPNNPGTITLIAKTITVEANTGFVHE